MSIPDAAFTIQSWTNILITYSLTLPSGPPVDTNGFYTSDVIFQFWIGETSDVGIIPSNVIGPDALRAYSITNGWYYYVFAPSVTELKPVMTRTYTIDFVNIRTWPSNETGWGSGVTQRFPYRVGTKYYVRLSFVKSGGVITNRTITPRTFYLASAISVYTGNFVTSSDNGGVYWDIVASPTGMTVERTNYILNTWRAYGTSTSGTAMAFSLNGNQWTPINFGNNTFFRRYYEGPGHIGTELYDLGIAIGTRQVGSNPVENILMYVDKTFYRDYTQYRTLTLSLYPTDILYNGSGWVIVGRALGTSGISIYYYRKSDDISQSSSIREAGGAGARSIPNINYVRWNGIMWIAAGYRGNSPLKDDPLLSYSTDATGATGWTSCTINGTSLGGINDVAWNGSAWIATCYQGGIFRSTDGITWNSVYTNENGTPKFGMISVAWTGIVWVGCAAYPSANGLAVSSDDGLTWNVYTSIGSGTSSIVTAVGLITLGNLNQTLPNITTPTILRIIPTWASLALFGDRITPVLQYTKDGVTTNTLPTTPGSYLVTINQTAQRLQYYAYFIDYNTYLVVNLATPNLTITQGLTYTYNNQPQGPTTTSGNVFTNSSGTITLTYSSSSPPTSRPINAGTYTVTASLAATAVYAAATATATFTINAGAASVTVSGDTSFVYIPNTRQGPATVTASSTGARTFLYSGTGDTSYASSLKPISPGKYNLVVTVAADTNFALATSAPYEFSIGKASASISTADTTQPYNGSYYTFTSGTSSTNALNYTTNPINLNATVTYYDGFNADGSLTGLSTLANGMKFRKKYTVVITITDPNYAGINSFTFTINPGNIDLTISNASKQYTGSVLGDVGPATYTQNGETDTLTYYYNPTPTNVGNYTVTAVGSSGNYNYRVTNNTFKITPAPASITLTNTTLLTQTFGSIVQFQTAYTQGGPSNDVAISATPTFPNGTIVYSFRNTENNNILSSPDQKGTYTLTITATNSNYSYTPATYSFTIRPLTITYILNPTEVTYNTKWQSTNITFTPDSNTSWTYTGQNITYTKSEIPPSTVGSYEVNPVVVNSNLIYTPSVSNIFRINKANAIVTINAGTLFQYYTGYPIAIAYTTEFPVEAVDVTYKNLSNVILPSPPIALGKYPVSAVIRDTNYQGSASSDLIISPVICQLIFENINVTFTGNPISATVYTIPGGHPVNLTYAPYDNPIYVAYPPTNVGRYLVRGIVDTTTQQNFLGQASTSMFISLLSIPLQITNNIQVFTSTVLTNTSVTNPPDLKVIYTYTPSPPLAVGDYQVTGQIQDSNYTGSGTSTLKITKATAPIRYSTLTQVYNTSNLYATILTTPPDLVTDTLYTVGTTTSRVGPVNVGTYTLVTTINDANYLGTNSATMNILKLSTFMTFSSLQQVYNGGYRSTIAITNPPDLGVSTFYNGSPIPPSSVGTYTVTGFIDNSNYAGYNTNILYINKLSTPVQLTNLNQNYTGSPIVPTVSVSPTSLLQNLLVSYKNISGTPISTLGPIINAGKYAVTALVQDSTYAGNSTSVLTIHPASTPIAFFSTSQIYTGKGLAPTFSTIPFNLSTYLTFYNSNALIKIPSTVGTYSVVASVIDSNNYFGNYGGTSTLSNFQITKATGSMTFVSSQIQRTYTGSNFPISVLRTSPSNLDVTYLYSNVTYNSSNPPSNVGSYTVIGSIQNQNYEGFGSTILNITQANAFIDFKETSYPYDTLQHSSMYETYPLGLTVSTTFLYPNGNLTNVPPTDIGIYTQYGTIQDSSYAGTYTTPFIIYKGIAKITISTIFATYNTVAIPHPRITTDPPNLPVSTLTFTSFASFPSYNSTVPPTNAGTYTMTATVNTDLYSNVASASFTIAKRTIPVALTGLQQIYNGRPLSIHAVTEPAGLKTTFTYAYNNNPIKTPSSIGTYSVTGTLDVMNYQGNKTAQFAIVLGPPQSLSAYAVDKGAVLAWTPPYGGVPIAEYEINTIPPTSKYTTTTTFTRINGLTNGIPYIFTVSGKNTLAPQGGLAYQAVVSTALTTSEFLGPSSIVATNGELYIADNHAIYQISSGVRQVFAGSVGNPGNVDGRGITAQFNAPSGIVADSLGNLYVADTNNNAVRKVDRQANVTTYSQQIVSTPTSITRDYFEILITTNTINNTISVIDTNGNTRVIAGSGASGQADGTPSVASFNAPQGIVVASNLDTYIADTGNHIIRKMDTQYNVTTIAGTAGQAGYVDATGSRARFSSPTGLAFNQEGYLFVADTGNNTIRKINTTTLEVTTIAGYGVQGDDNGDGANATFMRPNSLTFDSNMTMYVLEPSTIRTVTFTPIARATPTATPVNYIPAAPTNLSATAEVGGSAIMVRWTPPPTTVIPLTSYIVRYNTQTVTIDDGTISSYIIRNLVGNVEYTISVQAVNLFGASASSVPITYTISQIPVEFSIASTIIYDDQITNPPKFPVISVTPSAPITLSYIDTTGTLVLAPSQIGIYTGTARVNTSQYAGISTFQFTILNSRPSAIPRATAVATNGQAIVRWIPPADIGGSPITSYTVTSYPDNIVANTADGLRTSIAMGPLTNGTAYFFAVVANNVRGSSPIVRTNTVIPVGPPSPPLNVAANINPQGIVTVTWSPPTFTNGAPISLYIINATPYNTAGLRVSIVVGGSTNTYRFTTGITPGVQYLFAVTATNTAGVSTPTSATYPNGAQYIVPYTIPDAPTITSAIASPGQITLSWYLLEPWITAVGPPSQLTITSFVVNVSPNIHNVLPFITSGTTTSLVIPNLMSKVAYAVSIYATNSIGNGLIANTQYITIPVSLTQTNPNQQNIPKWYLYSEKVPVTYSITNTAVFFTGYPLSPTIVLSIADVPYNLVYQDTFGNIVAQPTAVGEYYGTIKVANDYYYGSQTFIFSILGNTPAMPTAIVVQKQGTFASPSVYLSWSAPQFTGQSPITYYTIVSNPATQTVSSSLTNTTITGLTSGVSYQFTITAYNTQGAGLPGKSSSITLYYTPSAPQASSTPSVIQSNGGVAISWLAPLFNGGLPILSYTLDIAPGPTITGVQITGYTIPPSVFVFGQLYSVCVYAVNRTGSSTALTIGPFTSGIATSAPVAATPIVPDYNNGTLRLNWLAPLDLNGSAVLYYTLYPRSLTYSTALPPIRVGNVLSYTLSGLIYGATYSFTVTATNDYGESVGLDLGTAIPGKPPSTPQYVIPAFSVENVTIYWGPSVANDIEPVIYDVGIVGPSMSFSITNTSFQFPGLVGGQTYRFTVVARNRFGTSGTLNIGPVVNGYPPSSPTNLRVTNASPNYDVVLTWDNSTGSPPISYNLVVNQATYNGVTSPFNVPNLLNGVQTIFQVFARNAVATSAPATLTYTPIVLAQTPQNPQVQFQSLTPTFTWTQSDVAQMSGFLVTLYYNTLSNSFVNIGIKDVVINGSSITFSGLSVTNGPGSYSYSIVANNGNTQSAPAMTNTVSLEAPLFIPQSAQSVVFSINDRNNQYFTWRQPDIRIVTSYTLNLYNNGSVIQTIRPGMFDLKIDGTQVSYTLLPLGIPGDYYYTIVAGNDYGDSTPVQTNTVSINTILPPTAVIARNNQIYFNCSWLGGNGLTYNVQFLLYNQITQVTTTIVSVQRFPYTYFSYTVPSLYLGSSYYFVITSVASDGRTSASVESNYINI